MKTGHVMLVAVMTGALLLPFSPAAGGAEAVADKGESDRSLMRDIRMEFSAEPDDADRSLREKAADTSRPMTGMRDSAPLSRKAGNHPLPAEKAGKDPSADTIGPVNARSMKP